MFKPFKLIFCSNNVKYVVSKGKMWLRCAAVSGLTVVSAAGVSALVSQNCVQIGTENCRTVSRCADMQLQNSSKTDIPRDLCDRLFKSKTLACATAVALPEQQHHFDHVHMQPSRTTKWDANWDSREPECLIDPDKLAKLSSTERSEALYRLKPKGTRHLVLIRHGQYNLDGESDELRTLTPIGREQAELTGARLADLGVKFTRLIYSTMKRATETSDLIVQSLAPELARTADPMVEEGAPFPTEPSLGRWRPPAKYLTHGTRIEAAFRKYFHRADATQELDSIELIICHANVIRYFVCRALQFPPEGWLRFSLANGSITWLSIRPDGRVVVKAFGESGHLPPRLVTYT